MEVIKICIQGHWRGLGSRNALWPISFLINMRAAFKGSQFHFYLLICNFGLIRKGICLLLLLCSVVIKIDCMLALHNR